MGYYDGLINQQINPQMVNTGYQNSYQNSYQNGYNYYNNFVKPNQNQQPQLPPQGDMKVKPQLHIRLCHTPKKKTLTQK